MKSAIFGTALFAAIALAAPKIPTTELGTADLVPRADCGNLHCCNNKGECGYFTCLEILCDAFPESFTCPTVCYNTCAGCEK
ncbi:hypothetical protein B0T25DRAFT_551870 [Lasiosphaeria hispida]|uniref:Uncharacterized protein n=1 Tax=Lasiosphaeria hispida TaxID=260671 RepID=A0AAJ0MAK2_9PEZI|nr:hypothetical protein B0T25DRAFT_551870 [Lasiosphaeria hispida]